MWRPPSISRSCTVTRRPSSIRLHVARSFSTAHIAGSSRTEVYMRGAGFVSTAGGLALDGATTGAGLTFFRVSNWGRWAIGHYFHRGPCRRGRIR
jgi:hypothetical protein